jgi:alpha-D-ribose 1-methylphosphonate 5-triphosphate synthase subunit PhnH
MNAANSSQWLQPAFNDPVLDAQTSFRSALKALSEPGLVQPLNRALTLENLQPATYALCLAFLDSDTPLWLAPRFDTPAIRANLAFHCGCPIVAERERALFALLDERELADLSAFDNGSERYPDQSCTLLVQLEALNTGAALRWAWHQGCAQRRTAIADGVLAAASGTQRFPPWSGCFFCGG